MSPGTGARAGCVAGHHCLVEPPEEPPEPFQYVEEWSFPLLVSEVWMVEVSVGKVLQAVCMSRPLRPLPDSLASTVFTTAEARDAGLDRNRLSGPEFFRLSRGVYVPTTAPVTELDIVSTYTRATQSIVACGVTAARLWGFPMPPKTKPWKLQDARFRIHLSDQGSHRRNSGRVRWRQLALTAEEIDLLGDARLTSRSRTLFDLAALTGNFSLEDLVAIGDHLVRLPRARYEGRSKPYATVGELERLAADHHGRGAQRLRQALELVAVGSDSAAETRLRLAIGRSQLPEPQLNVAIFDGGVRLGQPDLSWPEWKVCVEHEGPHHRSALQQEKDIARGERRRDHGWIEVQTTALDLRRKCGRALARISEQLRRRGWKGES